MLTKKVIDELRNEGHLDPHKVTELTKLLEETGETLDHILIKRGFAGEAAVLQVYSQVLGYPFLSSLDGYGVPAFYLERVPIQFARNYNLIGIAHDNGIIQVATCSPSDSHPLDELSTLLDCEVEPVFAPRHEITTLINRSYVSSSAAADEAQEDAIEAGLGRAEGVDQEKIDISGSGHDQAPIIRLVNQVFFDALKRRASDIHFQPYDDRLTVRYRIDGILYDVEHVKKRLQEAVIGRLKVMGRMDIAERRLPQDGRSALVLGDTDVDLRISSLPTQYGERVVLRLLDKTTRMLDLEELGFTGKHLSTFSRLIRQSHGIVLVTGPTGSGKSTTLYASLKRINSKDKNVITVEDPIEYNIGGISQVETNPKKGLTFATALRSILRQDPDIIMIGEIRDQPTAKIAIESALTGHLVFSTLHTNDSASAITRLVEIGVEPYLVSSSVLGVCAQRLVRLNCPSCVTTYTPEEEELREIGLSIDRVPEGVLHRGGGCELCMQSGYMDRTGIYELLIIEDHIREMINRKSSAGDIKSYAVNKGMATLRMDGAAKVLTGTTTPEEVLRVTHLDVE
jgi:general secretion pathway protein E